MVLQLYCSPRQKNEKPAHFGFWQEFKIRWLFCDGKRDGGAGKRSLENVRWLFSSYLFILAGPLTATTNKQRGRRQFRKEPESQTAIDPMDYMQHKWQAALQPLQVAATITTTTETITTTTSVRGNKLAARRNVLKVPRGV